jgi:hypothetical protein
MRDCDEEENTAIYDMSFRKKYQNIFRWVVTVSSSVMVGLIVEVWYFRDDLFPNSSGNNVVTNTVIISIIGGLSRIYYGASLLIGRLIMWILKYYKQRDIQRQREVIHEQVELSVTETGVKIVMEDDAPLLTRSVSHDAIHIIALKPNVMSDVFN